MSAAMDVLDRVIASVDPTISKEHANWHGELCVARGACVELIEAASDGYPITVGMAEGPDRHGLTFHPDKAERLLAAIACMQSSATSAQMTKAQEAEQASIRG